MSEFAVPGNIERSARRRLKKAPVSGEGRASPEEQAAVQVFGAQTIEQLNKKVERFTLAHEKVFGFRPTHGLAFDILRAPVRDKDYEPLLTSRGQTGIQIDASRRLADPREGSLDAGDILDTIAEIETRERFESRGLAPTFDFARDYLTGKTVQAHGFLTFDDVANARVQEAVEASFRQREDFLDTLDPSQRDAAELMSVFSAPPVDVMRIYEEIEKDPALKHLPNLTDGGNPWDPIKDVGAGLGVIFTGFGLDAYDIGSELIRRGREKVADIPGGGYLTKALAVPTLGISLLLDEDIPIELLERDWVPRRSMAVARAIFEALMEPYRNPSGAHAFWYFLDGISVASVVGAVFGKGAQFARAARYGVHAEDVTDVRSQLRTIERQKKLMEDELTKNPERFTGFHRELLDATTEDYVLVANQFDNLMDSVQALGFSDKAMATMSALGRRPLPGTFELGVHGYTADFLLSENYGYRMFQKVALGARQRRFEKRWLTPGKGEKMAKEIKNPVRSFFRSEAKIGRARDYQMRLEYALNTAQTRRVTRFRSRKVWAEQAWNDMLNDGNFSRKWNGVSRLDHAGLQKAIQMRLAYPEKKASEVYKLWYSHHQGRLAAVTDEIARTETKLARLKKKGQGTNTEKRLASLRRQEEIHKTQIKAVEAGRPWLERAEVGDLPKSVQRVWRATEDMLDDLVRVRKELGLADESEMWRLSAQRAVIEGSPDDLVEVNVRGTLDQLLDAEYAKLRAAKGSKMEAEHTAIITNRIEELNDAALDPRLQENPVEVLIGLGVKDDEILKLRKEFADAPRGTRYVPLQRAALDRPVPDYPISPSPSYFGLSEPMAPPQMRYSFSGRTLYIGDYRIDVTNMATEQLRAAVRYGIKQDFFEGLWKIGKPTPAGIPRNRAIPVRNVRSISEDHRRFAQQLEGGFFSPEDAARIDENIIREMDNLVPGEHVKGRGFVAEDSAEFDRLKAEGNIRWVDSGFLPHRMTGPQFQNGIVKAFIGSVGITRDALLYARPAYWTNILGSGAMTIMHQGLLAPANFGRALNMRALYGDDVAEIIKSMAGTGKTASFAPDGPSVNAASRWLREFWTEVTDAKARESAVIMELRRRSHRLKNVGDDGIWMKREVLTDPENTRIVSEAARRARRAMVDFDNLLPFEKGILQHVILIYRWMSRSTVYGVHTLIDRPVKFGAAARAATLTEEEIDEKLGGLEPEWMNDLPNVSGESDWLPRIPGFPANSRTTVNTIQANPQISLHEGINLVHAAFEESKYNQAADLLNIPAKYLTQLMGLSPDGYRQEPRAKLIPGDFPVVDQLNLTLESLPHVAPLARQARQAEFEEPPVPALTQMDGLNAWIREWEDAPTYLPIKGLGGEFATLYAGSLTPREQEQFVRLAKGLRDARDSNPDVYWGAQAAIRRLWYRTRTRLLGKPETPGLEERLEFETLLARKKAEMGDEFGQPEVAGARGVEAVNHVLLDMGAISEEEHRKNQLTIGRLAREGRSWGLQQFKGGLLYEHMHQEEWEDFNEDVRVVSAFLRGVRGQDADPLRDDVAIFKEGVRLGDVPAIDLAGFEELVASTDEERRLYAVAYSAYLDSEQEMKPDTTVVRTPEDEDREWRRYRDWVARNGDVPITIDGKTYPSFEAARFVMLDTERRFEEMAEWSGQRSWGILTNFQKRALGRQQAPEVAEGWLRFGEAVEEFEATGRKLTDAQEVRMALSDNDEDYPGFGVDYTFSRKLRGERWLATTTYQMYREEWDSFVTRDKDGVESFFVDNLQSMISQLNAAGTSERKTAIRARWKKYVNEEVLPAIATDDFGRVEYPEIKALAGSHGTSGRTISWFHSLASR